MNSFLSVIFFISAFFVEGDVKVMGAFIVSALFSIAASIDDKK